MIDKINFYGNINSVLTRNFLFAVLCIPSMVIANPTNAIQSPNIPIPSESIEKGSSHSTKTTAVFVGDERHRSENGLQALAVTASHENNGSYVVVIYGKSFEFFREVKATAQSLLTEGKPFNAIMIGRDHGENYADVYWKGQKQNESGLKTGKDLSLLIKEIEKEEFL